MWNMLVSGNLVRLNPPQIIYRIIVHFINRSFGRDILWNPSFRSGIRELSYFVSFQNTNSTTILLTSLTIPEFMTIQRFAYLLKWYVITYRETRLISIFCFGFFNNVNWENNVTKLRLSWYSFFSYWNRLNSSRQG